MTTASRTTTRKRNAEAVSDTAPTEPTTAVTDAPSDAPSEQPKTAPKRRAPRKAAPKSEAVAETTEAPSEAPADDATPPAGQPKRKPRIRTSKQTADSKKANAKSGEIAEKLTGKKSTAKQAPAPAPMPTDDDDDVVAPSALTPQKSDGEKITVENTGKIFAGFKKFRPMLRVNDRNKNRVSLRFSRPLVLGQEVSTSLLDKERRESIKSTMGKVKDLAPWDKSTPPTVVFCGVDDKNASCYWLIGTLGDTHEAGKVVYVREYTDGKISAPVRVPQADFSTKFRLGLEWDLDDITHWQMDIQND